MCKILIFGGTTEGRLLAEFCDASGIPAWVSVVSGYGRELIKKSAYLRVNVHPMEESEMENFLRTQEIALAVDATHPYAVQVTANIERACRAAGVKRIRCIRAPGDTMDGEIMNDETTGDITYVPSVPAAAAFLAQRRGNVLVTTGSKELTAFSCLSDYKERVYARVLPSAEAVRKCGELGLLNSHLICMQGPFSEEMNVALIHQVQASFLVTKEAGTAGGFEEKIRAAKKCGIQVIAVRRAAESGGLGLEDTCEAVRSFAGKQAEKPEAESSCFQHVALIGIGPGGSGQITQAALKELEDCGVVFGAARVLEAVKPLLRGRGRVFVPEYLPEAVIRWPEEAGSGRQDRKAAVVFSGDTGFYSGAKNMAGLLKKKGIPYRILPGISCVSYFAAKLGTVWEDAVLLSAHGRELDPVAVLKAGESKIFLLLGGENGAAKLCRRLSDNGYGRVHVSVGENLSYEDERIMTGVACELMNMKFGSLCLALIEEEEDR